MNEFNDKDLSFKTKVCCADNAPNDTLANYVNAFKRSAVVGNPFGFEPVCMGKKSSEPMCITADTKVEAPLVDQVINKIIKKMNEDFKSNTSNLIFKREDDNMDNVSINNNINSNKTEKVDRIEKTISSFKKIVSKWGFIQRRNIEILAENAIEVVKSNDLISLEIQTMKKDFETKVNSFLEDKITFKADLEVVKKRVKNSINHTPVYTEETYSVINDILKFKSDYSKQIDELSDTVLTLLDGINDYETGRDLLKAYGIFDDCGVLCTDEDEYAFDIIPLLNIVEGDDDDDCEFPKCDDCRCEDDCDTCTSGTCKSALKPEDITVTGYDNDTAPIDYGENAADVTGDTDK